MFGNGSGTPVPLFNNRLNSGIQQEVINFFQVILQTETLKEKETLSVITVYLVYGPACGGRVVPCGIHVVKVYFLLWVYLCGVDGAPQV